MNKTIAFKREVRKYPACNPWMIEVAMHCRGYTVTELATITGIKRVRLNDLINGNSEPIETELKSLAIILDYPVTFFEQYPTHRIVWDGGCLAKNEEINYLKYKVVK